MEDTICGRKPDYACKLCGGTRQCAVRVKVGWGNIPDEAWRELEKAKLEDEKRLNK